MLTALLTDMEWQALLLSAKIGLWATLVCLLPGLAIGWLLARRDFIGKSVLESAVLMPMVLPPQPSSPSASAISVCAMPWVQPGQ